MKPYTIIAILLLSCPSLAGLSQAQSASATIPITVRLIRRGDVSIRPQTSALSASGVTTSTVHITAPATARPAAAPAVIVRAPAGTYSYTLATGHPCESDSATATTLVTIHFW